MNNTVSTIPYEIQDTRFDDMIVGTVLNIAVTVLVRILQRVSPFHINTRNIHTYDKKPIVLISFKCIRTMFFIVLLSNSILIAANFKPIGIALYVVYWAPVTAWWHLFYDKQFKMAMVYGIMSAKCGIFIAVTTQSLHLWFVAIAWSIYISYLAAWYQFCNPDFGESEV